MEIKQFKVGDTVEMKKPHPCGSKLWKVLRTGADVGSNAWAASIL